MSSACFERVHAGAVGRIHRMQRLDGERHPVGAGMRQDGGDAVGHHVARGGDVARTFRQAADDQDQAVGAECRRLVDRAAIVVDGGGAAGGVGGRKHAAPAKPGDAQAVGADDARRLGEADLFDLVAPRRDRRDAAGEAGVDRLVHRPLLANGGEIDRQPLDRHGRPQFSPPTASTLRMRPAARSGSRSTRAWSARRKSSARCTSERALCWPPTMTK